MGKIRRGGYIFLTWIGDHQPYHVHIYKDGEEVVKYNLEDNKVIRGKISSKILKLLKELRKEGKL